MTSPVLGIDLGTTFSCVALYYNGETVVLPNQNGKLTTPSIVCFDKNIYVGDNAKTRMVSKNQSTLFDSKRLIGRKFNDESIQQAKSMLPFPVVDNKGMCAFEVSMGSEKKIISPEEVSSHVLTYLKKSAEAFTGKAFNRAVITVPAFFSDAQRRKTQEAAEMAGLKVERLLHEPTAAALAYSLNKSNTKQKVLVFDFGGGTLDVTIMTIEKDAINVLATSGNTLLGGRDIDSNLVKYFAKQIQADREIDIFANPASLVKVQQAAEIIKCNLSAPNVSFYEHSIDLEDDEYTMTMTRSTFEKLNEALFQKCIEPVKDAVAKAKLTVEQLDVVLMVGGSSRIPYLKTLLNNFTKKEPQASIHPDHAIALGAAAFGATLGLEAEKTELDHLNLMSIRDITPMSLGICLPGFKMGVIIEKGTQIPATVTKMFQTSQDNQTKATVAIYEGEDENVRKNFFLGRFEVTNIPPKAKGLVKFEVIFSRNDNGILKVTCTAKGFPSVRGEMSCDLNSDNMDAPSDVNVTNNNNSNKYFNPNAAVSEISGVTQYDAFLNPAGTQYDLGVDGAFDQTVLIGKFYSASDFTNHTFDKNAGADLKRKGFRYKIVNDENSFIYELPNYEIAWIISNDSGSNQAPFVAAVEKHAKAGKPLYIWGDNAPFYVHANWVLERLCKISLTGNTPGDNVLKLSDDSTKRGTFYRNHLITTGIVHLYEGVTICYPANNNNGPFKLLATSTDGNPVILFKEEDSNCGRIVLDCGFTKLWCQWDSAGTGRYISNATVWLTGVDVKY